jgi:hypothetical protein
MCWEQNPIGVPRTVELQASALSEIVTMTSTPRPRFDQWLLAQTDREDPVGDIAREFSEDRSVGCAGDIRTLEQLIGHIERVHHAIDLAICAVEQARAEYLRGRVDLLRGRMVLP